MNSSKTNISADDSAKSLIDWNSPEIVKNKTFNGDLINNPFDILELKAANMDPFDIVPEQIPFRLEPPCSNILSPLWEPKDKQIQKSVSLTNIHGAAKNLELNYVEKVNDNTKSEPKDTHDPNMECDGGDIVDQLKDNCVLDSSSKQNEEKKSEFFMTPNHNEVDIEKISSCNEEEKKQLREQTRQRIEMLIEKGKQVYEEKCSQKSLLCTPQRKTNLSLNKTESLFNKGFINNGSSNSNSDSSIHTSFSKTIDMVVDINDNNTSNASSVFPTLELNSFDLNSLMPEWVVDNFSDNDGSIEALNKNLSVTKNGTINNIDSIDVKFKTLNHMETIKLKSNGTQKFVQNKRIQNKGPFLANVPLQQMVKNYKETDSKIVNRRSLSPIQLKPIASSTPTLDIITTVKTPTSIKLLSSSNKNSLPRRSVPNSIDSPGTPLNVTKCIKKHSTNMLIGNVNKSVQLNTPRSHNSVNKRSNSTVNLFNEATTKKIEIQKSFQLNKSKSESKISKISKPMVTTTNKISGLPVSKRFTMSFKGKENMQPQ